MDRNHLVERLQQNRIFAGMSPAELGTLVDAGRPLRYGPGEDIVRVGDAADAFYLVAEGQVEVWAPKDGTRQVLAQLGPGQVFGEMAYIFPETPRIATVTPLEPTEVLRVTYADFRALEQSAPATYHNLVGNLSKLADARNWANPLDLIFQHYIAAYSDH